MALSPFPIPRELRQTDVLAGNGGKVYGPFAFKIFDVEDVTGLVRLADEDTFSPAVLAVTKVAGLPLDFFTVEFADAVPVGADFVIAGIRLGERSAGVRKGTQLDPTALEKEISKLVAMAQELRRDVDRSLKADFGAAGQMLPTPDGVSLLGWDADGKLVNRQAEGESAAEAMDAAARAEAAAASVNLPIIGGGDAGRFPVIKPDGSGYLPSDRVFTYFSRSVPLNAREFGAFGNDNENLLIDERVALQNAINAATAQRRELVLPETQYLINGALSTSGVNVCIRSAGKDRAILRRSQAGADAGGSLLVLSAGNAAFTSTSLIASDVKPGQERIPLTSVAGIVPGMFFTMTKNVEWPYDGRGQWMIGEMHRITRVLAGSNTIVLDGSTRYAYDVSAETIVCHLAYPQRYCLDGLHLIMPQPATAIATGGLFLSGAIDLEVNNIRVEGMTSDGVAIRRCWNPRGDMLDFDGRSLAGVGYGLAGSAVMGGRFTNVTGRSIRRLFDFNTYSGQSVGGSTTIVPGSAAGSGAAVSRDVTIDGFQAHGGGYGYGTLEFYPSLASGAITDEGVANSGGGGHGGVDGMKILNGFVENVRDGITVRSRKTVLRNIDFRGQINRCVYATDGVDLDIQGCSYDSGSYPDLIPAGMTEDRTAQADYFLMLGTDSGGTTFGHNLPVILKNNRANGLRKGFVNIAYGPTRQAFNLLITHNDVQPRSAGGDTFNFIDASNGFQSLHTSEIHSNEFSRHAGGLGFGSRAMYAGSIIVGDVSVGTGGPTGVVKIGASSWRARIPNNAYTQINYPVSAPVGLARLKVQGTATAACDVVLGANSATPRKVTTGQNAASGTDFGTDTEFTTSALTGTTGNIGKFTIRHSSVGVFSFENRTGAEQSFIFTIEP